MQEILSAKAAVEEHGPIVVATVEGLKTHLQEPLEKMLRVFRDPYEANRQDIDSILLTATLWNLESGSELLPRPGTVVNIDEYSNLQLYRDSQCQLTTRLSELNWERSDIAEWEAVLAQPQWKARNGASLKRKFRNMCIASKQAGTELAGATRWVQSMMTMKKRGEAKQEPSRCSTNEPPDIRRVPLDVPQQAVDPVVSYPARDVEQLLLCWSNVPGYSQIPLTTPQ
ncbi:hypothetical protein JG687_00018462 [Phytophthora cactorum]|uniref:Uncharacterized protein n=1 Tax=Phytophthora cactorum TaxID=29920 RepID=A0A8T1TQK1_9STRA|nr:hypothetical protein JG687_00018462 [Phytophthora cactorum]